MSIFSWTQPICDDCWDRRHPEKPSPRTPLGMTEFCVDCKVTTASGIYIRLDPNTAAYPTTLRRPA